MFCKFRIVSIYIPLVLLLMVLTASSAAQRLAQGSKAAQNDETEFLDAYCSSLTGGFRVCRTRTTEDGGAEFVIQKNSVTVTKLESPFWWHAGADPDSFFSYRGDLDNDGSKEVVLVSLEGVSNGMGVTYSSIYIFDGRTVESGGKPISFPIQEFGEKENFIYNQKRRRTEILISYWNSYESIEPGRIMGMYLIGKWFRYNENKLEPISSKPTLARRFLNSFAAERDNGWFENRRPYTWLSDRRTHKLFREPAEKTKPISTKFATVRSYNEYEFGIRETEEFEFLLDDGGILKGEVSRKWPSKEKEKDTLDVRAIGVWDSRYLYPLSYAGDFRLSTFLKRIEGRGVRLETYLPEYGDEFTKVWLLD